MRFWFYNYIIIRDTILHNKIRLVWAWFYVPLCTISLSVSLHVYCTYTSPYSRTPVSSITPSMFLPVSIGICICLFSPFLSLSRINRTTDRYKLNLHPIDKPTYATTKWNKVMTEQMNNKTKHNKKVSKANKAERCLGIQ